MCVFQFVWCPLVILMDVFQYLTVGVTVMLAAERYIAICHPMRARSVCTVKRARTIIVLLAGLAFILRSPKFFDLKFTTGRGPNGETILVVDWAYPYNEKLYTYIVTSKLRDKFRVKLSWPSRV